MSQQDLKITQGKNFFEITQMTKTVKINFSKAKELLNL